MKRDPRPPVLYLRPFIQDGGVNLLSPNAVNRGAAEKGYWRQLSVFFRFLDTYEQHLALAFRKLGPFVAIGDPADGLPQLGAIRVYVGVEGDWQQVVSELASKARYVLLQIGKTDGLMWEAQWITNHVRPEQLILCLPNRKFKITRLSGPKKREQERQNIYQVFRVKTQEFFPKPLPVEVGNAMFIYFDQGWVPIPSYFRSERIFSSKRSEASYDDPKLEALNWLNSILC